MTKDFPPQSTRLPSCGTESKVRPLSAHLALVTWPETAWDRPGADWDGGNWGERKTTAEGEGAGRKEGRKTALFSPPPPATTSFSAHPSFPPAPRSAPGLQGGRTDGCPNVNGRISRGIQRHMKGKFRLTHWWSISYSTTFPDTSICYFLCMEVTEVTWFLN